MTKVLDNIEDFLIQSDVGVAASEIKIIISKKKLIPNKDLNSEINHIKRIYNFFNETS